MLLDNHLPAYHFREVHAIAVCATPEGAFRAIKELTPAEIPLVRALLGLRALPARLVRRGRLPRRTFDATRPFLEQVLGAGFVLLGEEPGRELVVGTIGRFWELSGGAAPPIPDAQAFAAFDRPGYAKAALHFAVTEAARGGVIVRTETRIAVPDPGVRRAFARYWRVVYPGSALIRRVWLRAIKRRAERERAGVLAGRAQLDRVGGAGPS